MYLSQYMQNILFFFFFCIKSAKSDVYFTLTPHLYLD